MRVKTENWSFEIEDSWLSEAGFDALSITEKHYVVDSNKSNGKEIFYIKMSNINPNIRREGIPIFNDGEVEGVFTSAKERTVSILKAIMNKSALPPVEVVYSSIPEYKYKLVHGSHRLHCSIAAGFMQIPAIYGFDISEC